MEEYKEGSEGKKLCFICAAYPCICISRRLDERIREMTRRQDHNVLNEKEKVKTVWKRKRSVSPSKNLNFCKGTEEEEKENLPMKKIKLLRKEEVLNKASIIKGRPQHQPFVHLDGAGAREEHQPPHHQRRGDGGEASKEKVE